MGESLLSPLCQRGVIPPFGKGRVGGILRMNVVIIMRLLIKHNSMLFALCALHHQEGFCLILSMEG
jgi:hypothetical protein